MEPDGVGPGPAVDEAVFGRLVDDLGAEQIGEVCRLFLQNASSGIRAVRHAMDGDDRAAAADAAHRLKAASGFLGAVRLADLCAAVEAGRAAGDAVEALGAELLRTAAHLNVLVERVAPSAALLS